MALAVLDEKAAETEIAQGSLKLSHASLGESGTGSYHICKQLLSLTDEATITATAAPTLAWELKGCNAEIRV